MEFEFMSADTVLPPCMPLPAAMLRLPISSTAKVMYPRQREWESPRPHPADHAGNGRKREMASQEPEGL